MACISLTSGLCRGCMDNVGGVKKAYITSLASFNGGGALTFGSGIPGSSTLKDYTTSVEWFPLVPSKNTSNYVETINISAENGTVYYNGVLSMNFNKMDASKRETVNELSKGETVVIFIDQNENYWIMGGLRQTPGLVIRDIDNGCLTGGTSFQTGTAKGDSNGSALTFTCDMAQSVFKVEPTSGGTLESDLASADALCNQ